MQGTVVTAGRARAVVVGSGQNTAIGKIRRAPLFTHPTLLSHASQSVLTDMYAAGLH